MTKISKVERNDILVGTKLQEIRTEKMVKRKEVADFLNVSVQQIAKYETGKNRISAGKLFELAKFFNIGISYFHGSIKYGPDPIYHNLKKIIYKTLKILDNTSDDLNELVTKMEEAERSKKR